LGFAGLSGSLWSQVPTEGQLLDAEVKKLEAAFLNPLADRREIRKNLADILRGSKDPVRQARGLRIHLDLSPGDEGARRELAELAMDLKRPQVSIRLFRKVVAARAGDMQARVGLGQAYETMDRDKEALATFEEVIRHQPGNLEALIGAASAYLGLNQPSRALIRATAAVRVDPGNEEARELKAEAEKEIAEGVIDKGDEDNETTPVQRVAKIRAKLIDSPGDVKLRKELAFALEQAGWVGEARLEYLSLVSSEGPDVAGLLGLARTHRELGDPTGARVYAEKALLIGPRNAQAHLEMARILDSLGRPSKARRQFHQAVTIRKDLSAGYMEWGQFEAAQGDLKKAGDLLDKASILEPDDATVLAAFAQVRFQQGKRAEAEELLERARKIDIREPLAWKLVAGIQEKVQHFRDAIQAWQEYLHLSPFDARAWLSMARNLSSVGDRDAAAQAVDVAISLDDEDPEILDGVESVLQSIPFRRDLEELRLLVRERRAHLLRSDGKIENSIRALEGIAEERARQLRRVNAEMEDPEGALVGARRRAALRKLLGLTRAKVRVHEALAELYMDMERDDDVERQFHELHHLDPSSAEVIRRLASFYYEKQDNRRAVAWYKEVPEGTRLTPEEKLKYAQALDARGREEQAEDVYQDLARTEHMTDEVEEGLGEHNSRKGNDWAAYRHFRRSLSLYGGNQASLESIRSRHKSETPDYWGDAYVFDDSDGINISQFEVGARLRIDRRTDGAVTASRFKVEDRFTPESSDFGGQLLLRHELSERFRLSTILGLARFSVNNSLAWDLRGDWNPNDRHHVWARFFQDSVNETPLGSAGGFERTGFELNGTWFAHHRVRLGAHIENVQITGGNRGSIWNLDLGLRPLGSALPGWLHFARGKLDYLKRVAPALYFSPQDQDRSDVYYELPFQLGEGLFVNMLYGVLRDFDFGLSHRAGVSAVFDQGRRGNFSLDYTNVRRTRSYHDFSKGFRSDEVTLQYNGQF
jgi:tetratricopeptide (TPR) repeat protein